MNEALEKGISEDMLDFFRSASNGKLPQRDTDVWKMVVKKFGHDRLAMGCDELGWQMNEYMVWWITGLRNPEVVEEVLRRKSKLATISRYDLRASTWNCTPIYRSYAMS